MGQRKSLSDPKKFIFFAENSVFMFYIFTVSIKTDLNMCEGGRKYLGSHFKYRVADVRSHSVALEMKTAITHFKPVTGRKSLIEFSLFSLLFYSVLHDESLHVLAEKYHILDTYSSTKNRKNDTLLLQISIKTFGICDIGVRFANSEIAGTCLETRARPTCRSLQILSKFKEVFSIQVELQ